MTDPLRDSPPTGTSVRPLRLLICGAACGVLVIAGGIGSLAGLAREMAVPPPTAHAIPLTTTDAHSGSTLAPSIPSASAVPADDSRAPHASPDTVGPSKR